MQLAHADPADVSFLQLSEMSTVLFVLLFVTELVVKIVLLLSICSESTSDFMK